MDTIGKRIQVMRLKHNLSLQQLAEIVGKSKGNISGYENDKFEPSAQTIISLAEYFKVSTDWILKGTEFQNQNDTENENPFYTLKFTDSLSDENLEELQRYAEYLKYRENQEQRELPSPTKEQEIFSDLATKEPIQISKHIKEETGSEKEKPEEQNFLPVLGYTAAGEPIEIPDDIYSFDDLVAIPLGIKADFALTVRGDSMEPDIPNGSTVAVKKQETVENGQIAIVSLNNHITCKTFRRYNGTVSLHSINRKYDPITIKEEDNIEVKIIGRVVR